MKAKFKIGDKVNYIPNLSGLSNLKLEIEYVFLKETDELSKIMGIPFEPTFVYGFKNTHLTATEKDLK